MNNTISDAYELFHNGIQALARMEQSGLRIDTEYIKNKKQEITKEISLLEKKFYNTVFYKDWVKSVSGKTVNIYSSTQLGKYLYKVKKYKVFKETNNGSGSTDEEALNQLGIPDLNLILRAKQLKKIVNTYLDNFEREQVNEILHPFFDLHLVKTFRGSSSNPNFQNIPKRDKEAMNICRKAIYPRPGHQLVELDYAQLEVRIAACYNNDPKLIEDIIRGDMHRDMAVEIFKIDNFNKEDATHSTLRSATKNGFVFPQFYGDYYKNCAVNLAVSWGQLPLNGKWKKGQGIKFEDKFLSDHMIEVGFKKLEDFTWHLKDIEYDFWEKRYYVYSQWKDMWYKEYQKNGYIWTKTGFLLSGVMNKKDTINYPIQGSSFHCLLWSIIEGTKAQVREHWDTQIVGQIHDSIILDVHPKELKKIIKIMKCIMIHDVAEHWKWITVPLDVDVEICDVDKSWAEKHSYK
jgi:DNA polymerase I